MNFGFNCQLKIFHKIHFIIILLLINFISVFSSTLDTALVRVFGGPGSEIAYGMKVMADSGLILAGTTNYYGSGSNSIYLIRTDKNGIHRWSKVLGGIQIEQGYDLAVQGDSAIIIVGFTNSYGNGGYDGYVIKTDTAGNLLWEKTIGGNDWDFLYSISLLSDGSAILCGKTFSFSNGGYDGYIVKIDSQGNQVWSSHVGGLGDESLNSCIVSGNNIFLVGTSRLPNNTNTTGYLVKMDLNGNILNQFFYTGEGNDGLNCIKNFNGNLLIGGYSQYPDSAKKDAWLFKVDTVGNIIWNSISNNSEDDFINDATLVTSDNIVYVGQKNPSGSGEKSMFIVRIDSSNGFLAAASFGGGMDEEGFKTVVLPGNRIAFCGYTTSYGAGNEDVYLVILPYDTTTFEYVLDIVEYTEQLSPIGIKQININKGVLYPNPSTGLICWKEQQNNFISAISLSSITGSLVYYSTSLLQDCFDFSNVPKGIYFYKINLSNEKTLNGKLILQ